MRENEFAIVWLYVRLGISALVFAVSPTITAESENKLDWDWSRPDLVGLLPPIMVSPDSRVGITVPEVAFDVKPEPRNRVLDLNTSRTLGFLGGPTGYNHRLNFFQLMPVRWSADSSIAVWEIAGKWVPYAVRVLKFSHGQIVWQKDVLRMAQKVITERTKAASPRAYAAAKAPIRPNRPHGRYYPEGFDIDVKVRDPVQWPIQIEVRLSANVKHLRHHPNLESILKGTLDSQGRFRTKHFEILPNPIPFDEDTLFGAEIKSAIKTGPKIELPKLYNAGHSVRHYGDPADPVPANNPIPRESKK